MWSFSMESLNFQWVYCTAERKTKTVSNEGNCPIYEESFEFQVMLPELLLLRFVVLDDDYIGDDFIGQYTIPFECLQTGKIYITFYVDLLLQFHIKEGEFNPQSTRMCCVTHGHIFRLLICYKTYTIKWLVRYTNNCNFTCAAHKPDHTVANVAVHQEI